jgi:[ribosomal protein S5]-alanine N-acetyltransferase
MMTDDFFRPQPVLDTPRLVLRPFEARDGADVERLAGDRAVADTTQNIPHPYPPGGAVGWIATHPATWAAGEGASYAITDRDTDTLVGAIGLAINAMNDSAELGYWIGAPYWNRGYASEAAAAIIEFGFGLGLHRIQARHLVRNPASGRVMQKAGMTYEGVLRQAAKKWGRFEDVAMYAVLVGE